MRDDEILIGHILSEAWFTPEQVAVACAVDETWLQVRMDEGLIPSVEFEGGRARLPAVAFARARRMRQVERDFEAGPELAALVADLLEEIDGLRARLRRAGLE